MRRASVLLLLALDAAAAALAVHGVFGRSDSVALTRRWMQRAVNDSAAAGPSYSSALRLRLAIEERRKQDDDGPQVFTIVSGDGGAAFLCVPEPTRHTIVACVWHDEAGAPQRALRFSALRTWHARHLGAEYKLGIHSHLPVADYLAWHGADL